jgi:hypothetical protein
MSYHTGFSPALGPAVALPVAIAVSHGIARAVDSAAHQLRGRFHFSCSHLSKL